MEEPGEITSKLGYPFLHADRIKTPTLFMGGDKDFNVPINGGEQMYQALRSLDVPTSSWSFIRGNSMDLHGRALFAIGMRDILHGMTNT